MVPPTMGLLGGRGETKGHGDPKLIPTPNLPDLVTPNAKRDHTSYSQGEDKGEKERIRWERLARE